MSGTSKDGSEKTRHDRSAEGFSEQERAAMKARAAELKPAARGGRGAKKAAADEAAVLAAIAAMAEPDRALTRTRRRTGRFDDHVHDGHGRHSGSIGGPRPVPPSTNGGPP
uniref:Uncharacterized protein n=2 Tax=Nonomuraea gerenzanensis TaxID=93944 RepID=A0A1M4EDT9_9ACTN|nr:hypothetical protein BN4615_P6402 [Nonomuraea gerenzanensis]